MRYLKFFGLVTAGQLVLFAVMVTYYLYSGLPNLHFSSPAFLYYWPLNYGSWGHANPLIFLIGPILLLGYSLLALVVYVLVDIIRNFVTRKY